VRGAGWGAEWSLDEVSLPTNAHPSCPSSVTSVSCLGCLQGRSVQVEACDPGPSRRDICPIHSRPLPYTVVSPRPCCRPTSRQLSDSTTRVSSRVLCYVHFLLLAAAHLLLFLPSHCDHLYSTRLRSRCKAVLYVSDNES